MKQYVEAKIQKGKDKKQSLNSRSTERSTTVPAAPFLMNIATPFNHLNASVNSPPTVTQLQDTNGSSSNYTHPELQSNFQLPPGSGNRHVSDIIYNQQPAAIPTNSSHNLNSVPDNLSNPPSSNQQLPPLSLHFLGQLIQSVVSTELQRRFPQITGN